MRLLVTVLLLLFTASIPVAAAPVQAPPGFVEVGLDKQTGNTMWFSPASIEYYSEYISVETLLTGPNMEKIMPGMRYITHTTQIRPQERQRRHVRMTMHDAAGRELVSVFNDSWRDINQLSRDSTTWLLYEKVMQTVRDTGLKPRPTPFYLATTMQMCYYRPGVFHISFDPSSIKFLDNYISVNTSQVNRLPANGVKYTIRPVMIRPGDKTFLLGPVKGYSEAGKVVIDQPGNGEWQPIPAGTSLDSLQRELLDYCKRNDIAVPGL